MRAMVGRAITDTDLRENAAAATTAHAATTAAAGNINMHLLRGSVRKLNSAIW